jgi:hypothetical protein
MPDVLPNRIGGIVERRFPPQAADHTASTAKTQVGPHGG